MRRPGRFVGWATAAILLGWALSWALPLLPGALARSGVFRVQDVRVEGARRLSERQVVELAAVPAEASLLDDPGPVAERVERHGLVREAVVMRRLPATLVVRIVEREPVALLSDSVLEPVDREGRRLPIDPTRLRVDLPLLKPRESSRAVAPPAALASAAGEIARLAEAEPTLWANISVATAEGRRHVVLDLAEPPVRLRVRIPLTPPRLREALAVLADATGRTGAPPASLDLRFADQVVVARGEND